MLCNCGAELALPTIGDKMLLITSEIPTPETLILIDYNNESKKA